MNDIAKRALTCLDLTALGDKEDEASTAALCAKAVTKFGPVAAVCLWPAHVAQAKASLAGTGVKVATVVNFPSGMEPQDAVLAATKKALEDGADEIDIVLPYPRWLRGEKVVATTLIARAKEACGSKTLKVILESGAFPSLEKLERAAIDVLEAGADFLKTSTGKIAQSATPEAARVLLEASKRGKVGVKISGGVRTLADAESYLAIADEIRGAGWAEPATFRFGASGLLDALLAALEGRAAPAPAKGY
ncbi:MAG: deoxyribose-phosphate aldolase [Tagaea sp.]